MQFACFKNIKRSIFNFNLNLAEVTLSWRHHESWRWRWKQTKFCHWKMYQREVTMKYGRLFVFKRHDSPEVWVFRYGLTLGIRTLKIMARTGVFVHVVCAPKHPISGFSRTTCIILTYLKERKSHSHQKMGQGRYFYERRQRTNKQNANQE